MDWEMTLLWLVIGFNGNAAIGAAILLFMRPNQTAAVWKLGQRAVDAGDDIGMFSTLIVFSVWPMYIWRVIRWC